jgi:hypothetical protein
VIGRLVYASKLFDAGALGDQHQETNIWRNENVACTRFHCDG